MKTFTLTALAVISHAADLDLHGHHSAALNFAEQNGGVFEAITTIGGPYAPLDTGTLLPQIPIDRDDFPCSEESAPLVEVNVYEADDCCDDDHEHVTGTGVPPDDIGIEEPEPVCDHDLEGCDWQHTCYHETPNLTVETILTKYDLTAVGAGDEWATSGDNCLDVCEWKWLYMCSWVWFDWPGEFNDDTLEALHMQFNTVDDGNCCLDLAEITPLINDTMGGLIPFDLD